MMVTYEPWPFSDDAGYKAAGYTHYIHYREWDENLGNYMHKGFPTTADAYKLHLKKISADPINVIGLRVFIL